MELVSLSNPPAGHTFEVSVKVDNAQTDPLPVTVWQIASQTLVTVPQDRSRTTFAIGESVELTVSPRIQYPANVAVNWESGSMAKALSDCNSLDVQCQDMQVAKTATPGQGTVTATILGNTASLPFTVVAPNQYQIVAKQDDSLNCLLGGSYSGARTVYTVNFVPVGVNYSNVAFRENFKAFEAQDTITFPNGKPQDFVSIMGGSDGNGMVPFQILPNEGYVFSDTHSVLVPVAWLYPNGIPPAVAFSYKLQWQVEYFDDSGQPVVAVPNLYGDRQHLGDQQAKVSLLGNFGGLQGPFLNQCF